MAACYHPEIQFSDPVFPDLRGPRAGGMWKMLCSRAGDLEIAFDGVEADDHAGRAHWIATYTWKATGRVVRNDIRAAFTFRDGLIHTHTDTFDLWKWTQMALGWQGTIFGWTPMMQAAIRKQGGKGLDGWMKSQSA